MVSMSLLQALVRPFFAHRTLAMTIAAEITPHDTIADSFNVCPVQSLVDWCGLPALYTWPIPAANWIIWRQGIQFQIVGCMQVCEEKLFQQSIWIGPRGTKTPLHCDPYSNLLFQVCWHSLGLCGVQYWMGTRSAALLQCCHLLKFWLLSWMPRHDLQTLSWQWCMCEVLLLLIHFCKGKSSTMIATVWMVWDSFLMGCARAFGMTWPMTNRCSVDLQIRKKDLLPNSLNSCLITLLCIRIHGLQMCPIKTCKITVASCRSGDERK